MTRDEILLQINKWNWLYNKNPAYEVFTSLNLDEIKNDIIKITLSMLFDDDICFTETREVRIDRLKKYLIEELSTIFRGALVGNPKIQPYLKPNRKSNRWGEL